MVNILDIPYCLVFWTDRINPSLSANVIYPMLCLDNFDNNKASKTSHSPEYNSTKHGKLNKGPFQNICVHTSRNPYGSFFVRPFLGRKAYSTEQA